MSILDEGLSKRITSLRFLLIIFVVLIHINFDNIKFAGNTARYNIPEYVHIIRTLISEIIARAAVPMFFLISGFLLYTKDTRFLPNLKKKSQTILLPFVLWTIISVIFYYTAQSFSFTQVYFANPLNLIRSYKLFDWFDIFLGWSAKRFPFPLVYQLWFLRDLFILNLLFYIIKTLIDRFPLTYLTVISVLWLHNINVYILSVEALLFFSLGYYIVKYSLAIENIDKIKICDILIIYLLTLISELFFFKNYFVIHKINILLGCIVFIKLSGFLIRKEPFYKKLAWLEGYSFFLYAFHEPLLSIIKKLSARIMPMHDGYLLIQYFSLSILDILISLSVGVLLYKLLPSVYLVLTGQRKNRLTALVA